MTDSSSFPTLQISRGYTKLLTVSVDGRRQSPKPPQVVAETERISFMLQGAEEGLQYLLRVGDVGLETASGGSPAGEDPGVGLNMAAGVVIWQEAPHFTSARGETWLHLFSRPHESSEDWSPRVSILVVVIPSKMSEASYQAMWSELTALAAGLVLDLLGKSSVSLGNALTEDCISTRSSQLELALLEELWEQLSGPLMQIQSAPTTALGRTPRLRDCWGSEIIGPAGLNRLARDGLDPRKPATPRPFRAHAAQLVEASDVPEHRMLRGFLLFLQRRVEECIDAAEHEQQQILRDRPFREIGTEASASLFEQLDRPRMERLDSAVKGARLMLLRLRRAQELPALRSSRPVAHLVPTPVFQHVAPYRRFFVLASRYLNSSLVILETSGEQRLRSTSRMYEQWVFLQLLAALRACGLGCESSERFIRRQRHRRFCLDLERGTRITFAAPDGRAIIVRYEPWILPRRAAQQQREGLCRGDTAVQAWSPDIVIEVLASQEAPGGLPIVEYAVVLDAKYSQRITSEHWDRTSKYLSIRATATRSQAVRQVWLVYPGSDHPEEIRFRDDVALWTATGPDLSRHDMAQGAIQMLPDPAGAEEASSHEEGLRPLPVATRFISGLLNYLGLASQQTATQNAMASA